MKKSMLGAAALAVLALAPPAHAATIDFDDGGMSGGTPFSSDLNYAAAAGEVNTPTITRSGTTLTITDSVALTLTTQGDVACDLSNADATAVCTDDGGFGRLGATLADQDDRVTNNATASDEDPFFLDAAGDAGNDTLTGSDTGGDALSGGAGDDTLDGRGGRDSLDDSDGSGSGGTNVMRGGADGDLLSGGPGADDLDGGDGADFLFDDAAAGGGTDRLSGGADDDFISRQRSGGENPQDPVALGALDGGAGEDTVSYDLFADGGPAPTAVGATVRLDAAATTTGNGIPGEFSDSIAGIEDVEGTAAADTIVGSVAANRLLGGDGNDSIVGGGGLDIIEGEGDSDAIDARDGSADRVRCSTGVGNFIARRSADGGLKAGGDPGDTAQVDSVDDVARCPDVGAGTTVTQVPPPVGPTQVVRVPVAGPASTVDRTAPNIAATKLPKTVKLSDLRGKKGLKCAIASTDATPNRGTCTLTGTARKGARVSKAGDLVLAEKSVAFTRTGRATLKLAKKYRTSVRKRARLKLTVVVADAAGNRSTKSGTVRVR